MTSRTLGPRGPLGVQGPEGPRGPDGWQLPQEVVDRVMIDVHRALMENFVFRRPWWKFWEKKP